MRERCLEFLEELRANWDDHYWWQKHAALQAALIAVIAGAIGLLFTWLETRVRVRGARVIIEAST